jgi:hypothetical protein
MGDSANINCCITAAQERLLLRRCLCHAAYHLLQCLWHGAFVCRNNWIHRFVKYPNFCLETTSPKYARLKSSGFMNIHGFDGDKPCIFHVSYCNLRA